MLGSVVVSAEPADSSFSKNFRTALVVYDRATGVSMNLDPTLSSRRLAPCSTFKIYNTLIGLELGLLEGPDQPWYRWDGVGRPIEGWNRDLTLREAFGVSAVPAYQILARQIGSERMKVFIDRMDYGSKDISSGIDIFWLPRPGKGSIEISADEQVALLNKLLDGKLPFSEKSLGVLREVMRVFQTDRGTLYGKTGTGSAQDGMALGWFVGFVENKNGTSVFACNITGGEKPTGKAARALVENFFKSKGLL